MISHSFRVNTFNPKFQKLLFGGNATDIFLNGHRETWVEAPDGAQLAENPFETEEQLADFAINVIAETGRHLDQANPFADVTLDATVLQGVESSGVSGLRIHAALASACSGKTLVSIRVHRREVFSLAELKKQGMFNDRVEKQLLEIVDSSKNFIISGSTGSGKTTLLRALMLEAAENRIVAIEDVAELNLGNDFFLSLQTRPSNIEDRGEISLDRLLREALRMRPDRLLVGEVRGRELITMLQALNTGHRGSATTIHANSMQAVPTRLLGIAAATGLNKEQVAAQVAEAFDYVIHLGLTKGLRRVQQIGQLSFDSASLEVTEVTPNRGRARSVEAA